MFDAAALDYLREPDPERLLTLLAVQTTLELAATRSERSRAELRSPSRQARSSEVLEAVAEVLAVSPEARVAAGLAATGAGGPAPGERIWMRDLLLGSEPGARATHAPRASGLATRP